MIFARSFTISNTEDLTTKDFQPYMFQVVPYSGIESRGMPKFFVHRNYRRFSDLGPDYECILNSRRIENADDDAGLSGAQRPVIASG